MGRLRLVAVLLALLMCSSCRAAAAGRVGPCDGPHSGERWCDASVSLDERVSALVKALTTGEKAGLLSNTALPVPRLGLPAYGKRVSRCQADEAVAHQRIARELTTNWHSLLRLVERSCARVRTGSIHQWLRYPRQRHLFSDEYWCLLVFQQNSLARGRRGGRARGSWRGQCGHLRRGCTHLLGGEFPQTSVKGPIVLRSTRFLLLFPLLAAACRGGNSQTSISLEILVGGGKQAPRQH